MYWTISVLAGSVWLGGLLAWRLPHVKQTFFHEGLVFAGSFLFALVLVHMLPELFHGHNTHQLGRYILLGFLAQLGIELWSGGIEHGHLASHGHHASPWLLVALCVHGLTDGLAVAMPSTLVCSHHGEGMLWGIALHKVFAGFALAVLLRKQYHTHTAIMYLVLFSLTSPIGVGIGHYMQQLTLANTLWQPIYACLIGGLLHIGMTILVEATPTHQLHYRRGVALLAGALVAVLVG